MAQCFRVLTTFPEDLNLVPRIHMAAHSYHNPSYQGSHTLLWTPQAGHQARTW